MSFANKFNKGVNFNIDTTGYNYTKLADLYNANGADVIFTVNGMYVFKGKIETAPVFILKDSRQLVNMPAHLTDTVREILNDRDAVEDVKRGAVGFTIREYESHNKKCYTINFVDIVPQPSDEDYYK